MLIGLCGPICAGKQSIVNYLVQNHGFRALSLQPQCVAKETEKIHTEDDNIAVNDELSFPNIEALDTFVCKRWREFWILKELKSETALETLLRRPFFLLVSVDAPVSVRWQRYKARWGSPLDILPPEITTSRDQNTTTVLPTLEQFVLENDEHLYNRSNGLAHLIGRAQLRLLNPSDSTSNLHQSLEALNLTNPQRLRPSWDQYFMELASLAAQRSNCMRRRVGCVIVRDKHVVSTGYNGTPRNLANCNEGGCLRCNCGVGGGADLSTCLCIHAEENALLEAGRERIRERAILYCNTCPCLTCSIKIVQAGITEVVYSQSYHMDIETARVFKEGGVGLRQFSPPRNGLVDLGL